MHTKGDNYHRFLREKYLFVVIGRKFCGIHITGINTCKDERKSILNNRFLRPIHTKAKTWGAFHLGKKLGNFGGRKSGISDW